MKGNAGEDKLQLNATDGLRPLSAASRDRAGRIGAHGHAVIAVLVRAFNLHPLGFGLGVLFLLAAPGAPAAPTKRVLIVHSFGNAAPPFTTASTAFETALVEEMGEPVDLDEVSLDVARYATLEMEEALVELLRKRQTRWQPDLVVPIGSPAGVFVAHHRDQLFPAQTPIIYTGMDQRRLPPDALQRNATFVGASYDLPGAVEDLLQLAPDTTNVVIVIGATPLERFWTDVLRSEYAVFTNRLSFTWFNDLSLEQIRERSAQLPPRSFLLLILFMRDAAGVTHNANDVLRQIHQVANAPINGLFNEQLGLGIVGGRVYTDDVEGRESARIAVRILRGEPATNFPAKLIAPRNPRYDWRELRRWNISEKRLPAGSEVLFRQPSVWVRYRWPIAGVTAFCLLQAALILGLLLNRTKRRRAESAAHTLSQRLIHAHEEERARLARELHDDLTQRVARMAIDVGRVEQSSEGQPGADTIRSVRDGLVGLSADIHALSYRLHPSILEDLGLAEALKAECDRFSRQESIPADLSVRALPAIHPDTALCLFRVAQESLRNVARHARAKTVGVSVRSTEGGLELVVSDDGIGMRRDLEAEHPNLGLASMQERVRLLGGEFEVDSTPGQGTTILAWVPSRNDQP